MPAYAGAFFDCSAGDLSVSGGAGTAGQPGTGVCLQYQQNIPHEQAGAEIAEGILIDCGFDRQERSDILRLILCHRSKPAAAEKNTLPALFYRADKLSRNCFFCPAQDECDWPEEKKNREITY